MLPRTLTILIGLPITVLCTALGGIPFVLLVSVLALASLNEFYALMRMAGHHPSFVIGNVFTVVFVTFFNLTLKHPDWEPAASGVLTAAIIVTFSSALIFPSVKTAVADIAVTLLGCLYVGWLFGYLILVRALTPHGMYLFFLIITIWVNDVTAYLVGRAWGRTHFSSVSPHKTVEGAVAGLVVSVLAAVIFGRMIHLSFMNSLFLGITVSVIGQVSDLVESLIKRNAGVKESGMLMPGHGGMLDRMDSFVFAAPVLYYYLSWFVVKP